MMIQNGAIEMTMRQRQPQPQPIRRNQLHQPLQQQHRRLSRRRKQQHHFVVWNDVASWNFVILTVILIVSIYHIPTSLSFHAIPNICTNHNIIHHNHNSVMQQPPSSSSSSSQYHNRPSKQTTISYAKRQHHQHRIRFRSFVLFGTYSYSSNNNNNNKKKNRNNNNQPNYPNNSGSGASSSVGTTTTNDNRMAGVISVIPVRKDLVQIEMIIAAEVTLQSYSAACTNLAQTMHFPGFPRGSDLPHNLVELIHGKESIQLQAVIQIVSQHIAEHAEMALRCNNYNPVVEELPRVTVSYETMAMTHYRPGEPLVFTIECDVIPEPEPEPEPIVYIEEEVEEIIVTSPTRQLAVAAKMNNRDRSLDDTVVQSDPSSWNRELIESMEAEYADLVSADTDYRLRIGDACEVQMVGYQLNSDGSLGMPLPSMTAGKDEHVLGDRVTVLLKGGKYMPGLVEGLIGMKQGEKITLFVTFPNSPESGPLAGLEISYDVEVMKSLKRDGSKPSVFY